MSNRELRRALERELARLPVMAHEDGYRSEALPKATLLDLLAMHPDEPDLALTKQAHDFLAGWKYDNVRISTGDAIAETLKLMGPGGTFPDEPADGR